MFAPRQRGTLRYENNGHFAQALGLRGLLCPAAEWTAQVLGHGAAAGGSPQVTPEFYTTCRTFQYKYYSCPSGCTNSGYWDYLDVGWGQYSADLNTDPCGSAKPGQSCSQPFALNNEVLDILDCCVAEYGDCGEEPPENNLYCCFPYVCLSGTGTCLPCLPVGSTCGGPGDCCSGQCDAETCCQLQGSCTTDLDCCCDQGVVCYNNQCVEIESPVK